MELITLLYFASSPYVYFSESHLFAKRDFFHDEFGVKCKRESVMEMHFATL
jgi:hypothetical protein